MKIKKNSVRQFIEILLLLLSLNASLNVVVLLTVYMIIFLSDKEER